ncbi:MAG: hypothetical protein COW54_09340 [Rhodobacteraceae bacterium CG17_big_fil_post_rev_8_21_14_2_50_63_15]|nr:ImmA/IrrE family metallo-endopeptidase [Roseovarius sp.]PIV78339.1 MAG: hypothetical protein COW54_09340 [Rhodobacteraceae bacterium CG17_big_fil_post_rev_8_21_14_2_50_63_15]
MPNDSMPITPAVVKWARERAGFSLEAAEQDFRKIASWESGDSAPSYPQLERLADTFKVPVAVFFFPEPPDLPSIDETFRTLGPEQLEQIPPRVRLLLRKARSFQIGLEELYQGRNAASRLITRDLAFKSSDNVDEIARTVREYLGVTLEAQFAWADSDAALKHWRRAFFEAGVYVFKDQFRAEGFSGFCLYHDEFPIIYVNNTTTKTRQIFTLFHELAHLLFHTSGVDTPDDHYIDALPQDDQRIEVICNRLAARLLVPERAFEQAFAGLEPNEATASEIARLFSVSREAIYRKFLDRSLITSDDYSAVVRRWNQQKKVAPGGNPYNTKIAYLGDEYITRAFQRFYQSKIDADQLADYLDTKPRNLTRLEEYFSRRAV